jgi:predicted ATPase/DNA-binding winged helix-turn-helix (wHTH) protein
LSPAPHRFGAIEVRPVERQLLIGGATVSIGARAFDVLLALIERRDRVVTKNELLDLVWPGLVVEENNLQVQISSLRKLLGPNVIATIPGRGYRLTLRESAVHTPPPAQIALPHHLPAERTRFIGRAAELQMCETLLRDTRLLTITGIGGGGKTRFAVELAKRQCGAYADGVWFVDLAPLQDGSRVVLAAAAPFGVQERPGVPLIERLAQRLAAWHALIVLDNCEHVLAAAAELIDTLLDACAALTFVATSREALGLAGEQCFALPPLSLPAEQPANDPRDSEAVRLFIDRAQLLRPDFAPTRADANVVGDICGRLDGIPLAIELAAGRIKVLSAEQIRARLDDRFRLLTAGQRNVPRHQTLQAAIQWSYDLLAADERQLLDTLSVFAGGWTLDAAVAVAGSEGNEAEILDRLTRLIDKSLVVVERTAGGGLRYHLLETVRQFAQQRLDAGGDADAVHSRHLDYFVPLALKQSESLTPAPAQLVWFDAELENLLAAHAWCSRVASAVEVGAFNAVGPAATLTMGQLLEACRDVTQSAATLCWIPDDELIAAEVKPWTELPLWIPENDARFGGMLRADNQRAIAAGLTFRALADTIRRTLDWDLHNSEPRVVSPLQVASLSSAREAELIGGARDERT